MQEIIQHTALGAAGDDLFLFTGLVGSRTPLKNERKSDEHPYIKFANARNLPEFMTAVDEIYAEAGLMDFICNLCGGSRPSSIDPSEAEEVAKLFEEKPTRTTIEKTREALQAWHFDRMEPSEDVKANLSTDMGILYLCTPLKDLIEAKEDLRRTAMLMAWLVGKCSFEMAHGLTPGDKNAQLKTIGMEKDTYLAEYYEGLRKNTGNVFVDFNLHSVTNNLHLYREEDIENTVRSYVQAAFSLLLSDETMKMSPYLKPYKSNNTILSAIWSFFAAGLDKEEGSGSIAVCKHCGRFYQQQRSTKQFCSDSCRVMHLREHAGESKAEKRETRTTSWRRELRERAKV